MQKLLARLFGQPETPSSAARLIQPEFNAYLQQAQIAIDRQDWLAAQSAYEAGLEKAQAMNNLRAQQFFLSGLGTVFYKTETYERAERILLDALEMAQRIDDPVLIARSQLNLGEIFAAQNLWDRAKTYHEQAVESARASNHKTTMVLALENLARVYIAQSNPTYAIHLLKEAVILAQESQDPRTGASVVGWLGRAHLEQGDRGTGRRLLEQAQRLAMQVGREQLAIQWVVALANTDLAEGDYYTAVERYQAAEDLGRRLGRQPKSFYQEIALNLSVALRYLGNFAQSQTQAERALQHAQDMGNDIAVAQALTSLGLALQGRGHHEAAAEKLETVMDFYDRGILNSDSGKAGILLALGKSRLRLKRYESAKETLNTALEIARSTSNYEREAEALHLLGSLHSAQNQRKEAVDLWKQAIAIF